MLVRHGVSRDLGELLLADMQRCLDFLKKNPMTMPLSEEDAGGFSHSK